MSIHTRSQALTAVPLIAVAVASALALSGCSPTVSDATPEAPASPADDGASTNPPLGPSTTLTFAAGAELSPETEIAWADGFRADPEWRALPETHPGRWSYVTADGTCQADFRGGVLGDAGDADDREASDMLIAAQTADAPADLAELSADGLFISAIPTESGESKAGAGIEHRQFSYTVNEWSYFIAARAFVEVDYSVHVIVTCEGGDAASAASDALSKNWISVDRPASP